jgi:hypothetical protein
MLCTASRHVLCTALKHIMGAILPLRIFFQKFIIKCFWLCSNNKKWRTFDLAVKQNVMWRNLLRKFPIPILLKHFKLFQIACYKKINHKIMRFFTKSITSFILRSKQWIRYRPLFECRVIFAFSTHYTISCFFLIQCFLFFN